MGNGNACLRRCLRWRSASRPGDCGKCSGRRRGERQNRPCTRETQSRRACYHEGHLRRVSHGTIWAARTMAAVTKRAPGFFNRQAAGVQVVTGRDDRKQQDQDATECAEKKKRAPRRPVRRSPLPPQHKCGQRQREPAKIKKKLHDHQSLPGKTSRQLSETRPLPGADVPENQG
jgi:hypothetical protein